MELAIPLVALGGMYVISNQNKEGLTPAKKKEAFNNMGIRTNLQEKQPEHPQPRSSPQSQHSNILPQSYGLPFRSVPQEFEYSHII